MKPLPMAGCHGARPVSCWSVLIAPDVLEHGVKNLGGPVKESSKGLDSPLLLFSTVATHAEALAVCAGAYSCLLRWHNAFISQLVD